MEAFAREADTSVIDGKFLRIEFKPAGARWHMIQKRSTFRMRSYHAAQAPGSKLNTKLQNSERDTCDTCVGKLARMKNKNETESETYSGSLDFVPG